MSFNKEERENWAGKKSRREKKMDVDWQRWVIVTTRLQRLIISHALLVSKDLAPGVKKSKLINCFKAAVLVSFPSVCVS